jgi:hypothetical protein
MTWLKHILVVIALMVSAMPCCHAADHDTHGHDADAAAEICATHACACHSCDEIPCSDQLEVPQEMITASASVGIPARSIQLIVFSETKPVIRQVPLSVTGILASIQTVQLLI